MRKQTDLAKVKQTARSLLFTDIHETEFSPVIVSHPFTDSGFVASPNADGEIGLLNITESDADQRRWREYMGKLIDGAKSAYEIYMMITKPYGLTFLKYTAQDLSQEDLSNILASAWTRAEAPNLDVNVSKAKLLSLFKQADPTVLMEQDEYVQPVGLPGVDGLQGEKRQNSAQDLLYRGQRVDEIRVPAAAGCGKGSTPVASDSGNHLRHRHPCLRAAVLHFGSCEMWRDHSQLQEQDPDDFAAQQAEKAALGSREE